jgi:hypothetical protein
MAKKAPAKPPAKRKPRAKKPVDVSAEFGQITAADLERAAASLKRPSSLKSIAWRSWLVSGAKAAALIVCGAVAGVYAAGGIPIGPGPVVRNDVLQQSYDADRITQALVLRELSEQDFDGSTDDGRRKAGEWFNAQRFRNRANDFGGYTDRVAEAIAANSEDKLAEQLKAK